MPVLKYKIETYTMHYPEEVHISKFYIATNKQPVITKHWTLNYDGELLIFKITDHINPKNNKLIKAKT